MTLSPASEHKVRSPGKAALLLGAGALALWVIVNAIHSQTARMEQAVNSISDLRDPSPFRVALTGHLDKIHLSALAYLRSPDAALPAQIKQSEKEFEGSLREFEKQNPRLFPAKAAEEIRDVFALLEDSVSDTMKLAADRTGRRSTWEQNFNAMLFLIDHRLRPLIRKSTEGQDRLQALLKIENQLLTWEQSLAPSWPQATDAQQAVAFENENKGETLISLYEEQEGLLAGERKPMRSLKSLWAANNDLTRQDFALGTVQGQALDRMNATHKRVQETLIEALPLMQPGELETKKKSILQDMRLHMIFAGALALTGIVLMAGTGVAAWRLWKGLPVKEQRRAPKQEASPEAPIMKMDLEGKIVSWSAAAGKMYEYDAYEITGQSISRLFASEIEMSRLYKEMKSTPHLQFETQHRAKSGVVFPVRMDFRPITDGGKVIAIGLICHRR